MSDGSSANLIRHTCATLRDYRIIELVKVTVLEAEAYVRRSKVLLTDDEREGVRTFLAEYPEGGDIVPGPVRVKGVAMDAAKPEQGEAWRHPHCVLLRCRGSHRALVCLLERRKGRFDECRSQKPQSGS